MTTFSELSSSRRWRTFHAHPEEVSRGIGRAVGRFSWGGRCSESTGALLRVASRGLVVLSLCSRAGATS